ncbi:MAG: ABC transporter ATP-binding protein [Candidatus Methanoplasma sp.]|nr:ABC transporter ATP-binding protein [Candidatus Methanoplasma sp.]
MFSYGDREVLKGISLDMGKGITSVIGPNAAGKSTLMRCMAGLYDHSGTISLDGKAVSDIPKQIAYMPQEMPEKTSLTVMEVMLMGRLDRLRWKVCAEDIEAAYSTLEDMGIEEISSRRMNELSGGQCQMVMVAQCLMRDPDLLLMDEPSNNLDLCRQLEMFETARTVAEERGLLMVMVLHDINLASKYSDRIAVLSEGTVYGHGAPGEVITEEMLRSVYGIHSKVTEDEYGLPHVHPKHSLRMHRRRTDTKSSVCAQSEYKEGFYEQS